MSAMSLRRLKLACLLLLVGMGAFRLYSRSHREERIEKMRAEGASYETMWRELDGGGSFATMPMVALLCGYVVLVRASRAAARKEEENV